MRTAANLQLSGKENIKKVRTMSVIPLSEKLSGRREASSSTFLQLESHLVLSDYEITIKGTNF